MILAEVRSSTVQHCQQLLYCIAVVVGRSRYYFLKVRTSKYDCTVVHQPVLVAA